MGKYKPYLDWRKWLMWVPTLIVTVGIGGLFINGTFLNTIFLSMLPQTVHTVVGWLVIASGVVGAVSGLFFSKRR